MANLNYTEQKKIKGNVAISHQVFLNHVEKKDRPNKTLSDWIELDQRARERVPAFKGGVCYDN